MDLQDHYDEMAKEMAGNWTKFESFGWHTADQPRDARENWCIIYTHHRDSPLVDVSNASVISKKLDVFVGDSPDESDIWPMHVGHWGVGWVDGYAIRIFRDGRITDAFKQYADLEIAMENYGVLDDCDLWAREFGAAIESIRLNGSRFLNCAFDDSDADGDENRWEARVWEWLKENDERELENTDGTGVFPAEKSICEALRSLGLLDKEEYELRFGDILDESAVESDIEQGDDYDDASME